MPRLRFLLPLLLWLTSSLTYGQFSDDFSDGNFTANPAWSGDNAEWEVLAGEFHLNAPAVANTSHMSTASTAMCNGVWEFHLRLNFTPSSTNLVDVFIASDIANMEGTLNGYCVRLGGTNRQVTFHAVTNGVKSPALITGPANTLNTPTPVVNVRVTRTGAGVWEVFLDNTTGNGTSYVSQGTATSILYTTSTYFGISTTYTSTRNTWCYFDNFVVTGTACPDTTKPTVASVAPTSPTTATVTFSEKVDLVTAQNTANYLFNNSFNPAAATVMVGDTTKILLDLGANQFNNCGGDSVRIANVQDRAGNAMLPDTLSSTYFIPGTVAYKSVVISELMADPSPAPACIPAFEFLEIHNRSNFPVDLNGWKISDTGTPVTIATSTHPLCPGDYAILCANAVNFAGYNHVIQVAGLPSLNNTGDNLGLRTGTGVLVDSVEYQDTWYQDAIKAAGGWTLELINPHDTCATNSNWIASNDACGGTPGLQNSVHSTLPDLTPPAISSIAVTGPSELTVCFNEAVVPLVANDPSHYTVSSGLGMPTTAVAAPPGYTCVTLFFATPIDTGTVYTLTATGVADCNGNSAATSGNFMVSGSAAQRAVIINEIFFDPDTLATNLPNVEYVELYNRGSDAFDLAGWKFSDTGSPKTLGNYILQPGGYVILCDLADTAAFSGLPYLGLLSWPSLNNTGDNLGLHDGYGNLVDSVEYQTSWYHDPSKVNGGWSIELINPNDSCNTLGNWAASTDADGGTPGEVNSILSTAPDVTAPQLVSVTVTGPQTLDLCFNEGLDAATANTAANYSVNNGLGTPSSATLITPGNTCVTLTFATPIDTGTVYTLVATGVEDCSGNHAPSSGIFVINAPAPNRAILFNEIYADPDTNVGSLPGYEYLELFNRSATTWDLGGWALHNGGRRLMGSYLLAPGGYVVLCKESDTAAFAGIPYLGLSSWPGLTNGGDELGLRDGYGNLVDTVEYDIAWYQDPNKDDGGWSLELINPSDSCALLGNWIASNDVSGGTPGMQNSVYDNAPDVTPPTVLSATVLDSTHVEVCFNETMDVTTLQTASNYSIDNGMGTPVAVALSGFGDACVTLTLPMNVDTGTVYTVTMTGMADCKGNVASALATEFVLGGTAVPFQVVINEIFPDESPVVGNLPSGEFVELYNNGPNVVSLAGWTLTDRRDTGTLPAFNLFPGGHVILCTSGNLAAFSAFGDALAVSGMPGLNNDGDSLEIHDANGSLMDLAYYDLGWYHDEAKEEGGWSMERMDPAYECMNGANWRASIDPNGATPGANNSFSGNFIDAESPTVLSVQPTSRSTVRVFFSELMDAASLADPANYALDNGIGQATAVTVDGSLPFSIELAFGNLMDTNVVYCLSVINAQDCPGNAIAAPNSTCFGIAAPVAVGDLIINEILFNPYTGGSDFVELYNKSDKIIDISQLYIGEIYEGTDSIFNGKRASTVPKIILPQSYLCLTADRDHQIATYQPIDPDAIYEMSSFPSYDDAEGECVIYTDSATVLDRLHYLDDWSFPNLDDKNGVSLERLDFNRPTQDQNNWHSAASTVRYATPGYKNSETLIPDSNRVEVWLQPTTFSPDQDGFEDILAINYHFQTPGWNVRVMVLDNKGRPVRVVQENTLIGTDQGIFTWDGTTDGFHKADVGVYVILFEAMNPNAGERKVIKLGCVLAARL